MTDKTPIMTYAPEHFAKMFKLMDEYHALVNDLIALEKKLRTERNICACLSETNIDDQNTMESQDVSGQPIQRDTIEYWDMMIRQAASAAGSRAEEHGIDLNKELGRVIY